jgi:hypothetical protein
MLVFVVIVAIAVVLCTRVVGAQHARSQMPVRPE